MLFICPTARNMIVFLLLIRVESPQFGMAGFWLDSVSLLTMQESESFVNASERGDREWSGGKLSYQSRASHAYPQRKESLSSCLEMSLRSTREREMVCKAFLFQSRIFSIWIDSEAFPAFTGKVNLCNIFSCEYCTWYSLFSHISI